MVAENVFVASWLLYELNGFKLTAWLAMASAMNFRCFGSPARW